MNNFLHFISIQKILVLVLCWTVPHTILAQNNCAGAITVADLTGVVCATSAPSLTNALAAGGCEEGTLDTWFSFTAQGPSATITVSNATAGWRPEFLVISGTPASTCAGFVLESCTDGVGNYTSINSVTAGLTAGEVYWIVVSSNGDLTTGTINVCVNNPAPGPCQDDEDCNNPGAFALNAPGAGAACIADCNNLASAGPDFAGANCFDLPNETVWYTFTTSATTTTLDVSLTSGTMTNPEFTIFTTADCATFTIINCVEGAGGTASSTAVAVTASTTYLIAVSDATGDEGNFNLCITQNSAPVGSCVDNDDCATPAPLVLNPTGAAASCVNDCNNGAASGPDFVGNNCYDLPDETVWYSITTAADVALLNINLTSADMDEPEFTLFTNACGPFTIVDCVEGTGGSASAAINVSASTTYLIAVSDAGGDVGTFDLCVTQFANTAPCNTDNVLAVTATSMGSPLAGPYQPGEVVTFCYTINTYMTSTTNCNYLQGIVPIFGDCWAPTSFNAQGMPTVTTSLVTQGVIGNVVVGNDPCENSPAGTWSWYPDGAVDYNLSTPNPLGLSAGDAVGAGWFFVTNYDSYEVENNGLWVCPNGHLDPDDNYGDNSFPGCTSNLGGWQVCFQLTANNLIDCQAGETDCTVQMKTFADGEIGVWQNVGCLLDLPTTFPATLNCVVLLQTGLEEFTGKNENDKNLLSWKVDPNAVALIDYFLVEKSTDGITWTTLGTAESVRSVTDYNYTDNSPYAPVTYYRLVMTDFFGAGYLSTTIAIASSYDPGAGLASDIQPNPAKNEIFFVYTGNNLNEPIKISVVNVMGQTISSKVLPVNHYNQKISLETTTLADGVYYIAITQGGLQTVKRICVIR